MKLNPLALFQLHQQYGSLKSVDVTPDIVGAIAKAFSLTPSEEGLALVTQTIREGDLDTLADYASEPDRLQSLMSLLVGPAEKEPPLVRCPHCGGLFELQFQPNQSE